MATFKNTKQKNYLDSKTEYCGHCHEDVCANTPVVS